MSSNGGRHNLEFAEHLSPFWDLDLSASYRKLSAPSVVLHPAIIVNCGSHSRHPTDLSKQGNISGNIEQNILYKRVSAPAEYHSAAAANADLPVLHSSFKEAVRSSLEPLGIWKALLGSRSDAKGMKLLRDSRSNKVGKKNRSCWMSLVRQPA